jgi:hypothetical protein
MPKVLPSDVVAAIEMDFPWARTLHPPPVALLTHGPVVAGLVASIDRLPEATLQLSANEYRRFISAVAGLQHLAKRFELATTSAAGGWPWPSVGEQNAITELWLLLQKCPDEGIEASIAGLEFLEDQLRASVRSDISSSEAALNNGQWKAATVLAGAALEALLLWAVARHSESDRKSALQARNRKADPVRPEGWYLLDYIEVANALGDIDDDTAKQANLAKNFRNLIHPGREVRTGTRCDRGTAHSTYGALHLVISDLARRGS